MLPALRGFGLECENILVRLMAYAGGLLVLAVIAADVFSGTVGQAAVEPRMADPSPEWSEAQRPHAAFAVPLAELAEKTLTYQIFRHRDGVGRRDLMVWRETETAAPSLQIEIFRPGDGGEVPSALTAVAMLAQIKDHSALRSAGMIDTKFGRTALTAFMTPGQPASRCLGFARTYDTPRLQIAGYACTQEEARPAQAMLACALDRLTLLASGNDPRVAALFAHAELKRGLCDNFAALSARLQGDWVSNQQALQLRGSTRD